MTHPTILEVVQTNDELILCRVTAMVFNINTKNLSSLDVRCSECQLFCVVDLFLVESGDRLLHRAPKIAFCFFNNTHDKYISRDFDKLTLIVTYSLKEQDMIIYLNSENLSELCHNGSGG